MQVLLKRKVQVTDVLVICQAVHLESDSMMLKISLRLTTAGTYVTHSSHYLAFPGFMVRSRKPFTSQVISSNAYRNIPIKLDYV